MQSWEDLPIYKKAKEIETLVNLLVEFVKDSDLPYADELDLELIQGKFEEMTFNANEISDLIASASESNRPYDYCMENAVLIKKAAYELLEDVVYIEEMGLKDIDYLDLLYDEIEALRLLFIEWIKTFQLWKYGGEDWGLFHPEGITIVDLPMEDEDFDDDDDDEGYDDEEEL